MRTAPPEWAEWNCSQWRNLSPSDALNRGGHKCKLVHWSGFVDYLSPSVQDIIMPSDIIIVQRNVVNQEVIRAIQYWQGMGKPVAVDLDDAYHILPWCNPAHKFWHENNDGVALQMLEHGLRLSDGLIAPNRLLLQDWAFATRGYYLQNYAEQEWWMGLPKRDELKKELELEDNIIIGWGGSVSHYDSWHGSGIYEAAKVISEKYPEVIWMICGNDDRVYEHLPVPVNRKYQQLGVPPEEWPKIVSRFDIGVAPLFGPYDQRRSWIKGLEYLLAGVPWIATRGEPYRDLALLGNLIENGAESWIEAIEEMILDLPRQQLIARDRVGEARRWTADNQVDTYEEVYGQVIRDAQEEKGVLPDVYYVTHQHESSANGDE